MNFKTSALFAVAASAMIFGSSLVMAEKPAAPAATQPSEKGERKKMDPDQKMKDALDTLGLSDDQKTKVAAAFADFKKSSDAWDASHDAEVKELKTKYEAAKKEKDEAKIKALETQKNDLWKSRPNTKKLNEDIKAILTPEQKTKLEAHFAAKKEKAAAEGKDDHKGHNHKPGEKHDHK